MKIIYLEKNNSNIKNANKYSKITHLTPTQNKNQVNRPYYQGYEGQFRATSPNRAKF